ncbi:hypothetical protein BC826DRAFT_903843, partial [Russula brevipes]
REVQQLRAEKAYHLDAISKHRGSISLALRAPDDVLALIFEHSTAGGWTNAPLVTSHVCAKWRRASFVPRVWSHIDLTSESMDPVAKTRLWLSRAIESPLCITVDVRVLDPHILDAFGLILERVSQWRILTLNTRFVQQANDILSQCRHPIPYLHTLDITSYSIGIETEQGVDELTGLDDAFAHAPSLSHVRIVSNRFPASVPHTVVDLCLQLSDIVTSRPSFFVVLQMLGTLPCLQGLTLAIPTRFAQVIYDNADPASTTRTCLHYLERLIIEAPPDFNQILKQIEAPVLRYLHLSSSQPPSDDPHEGTGGALLRFLRSSNPPIRFLELRDVDICQDDLKQCFLSLRLLEELRLRETEISSNALRSLHGPTGACPRLKRLHLRWCKRLVGQALVDLVQSRVDQSGNRSGSCDPIEEITVAYRALVDESSVIELAPFTVSHSDVVRDLEDHCRTLHFISIGSTHFNTQCLARLSRLLLLQ